MVDLTGLGHFAGDDGSVPEEVAEVLGRAATGMAGLREVVRVLAGHRLLIPLLEVDADLLGGDDADPCAGQDRAVAAVSVRAPGGSSVGLAFTGMPPLSAWDPRARPMPVTAPRAAASVLVEGGTALVVDPAGPCTCRLTGLALARLAAGGSWPDPWADPAVQDAVGAELARALAAGDVQVRLGPPVGSGADVEAAGLCVDLRFPADVAPEVAAARAGVVAQRLSGSAALRAAFDGVLAVRVVGPAG